MRITTLFRSQNTVPSFPFPVPDFPSLVFYTDGKQSHLSSVIINIKIRICNQINSGFFYEWLSREMKINGRVIKLVILFWFYSICWLTMSLAEHERVSSKFQVFPRSFASWPNIDLSVNFLAVDFISRHTSRLKGFIYKLIK